MTTMWWFLNEHVRIPDRRTGIVIELAGDEATVRLDDGGELVTVLADDLDAVTWP